MVDSEALHLLVGGICYAVREVGRNAQKSRAGSKRIIEHVRNEGWFVLICEMQVGGFFMIEANDLDEAISIAGRIPSARMGTIEVRPVMESAAPAAVAGA